MSSHSTGSNQKVAILESAAPPLPCFTQAVISKGMVYCSGFVGCESVNDTGSHSRQQYGLPFDLKLVQGGVKEQTILILSHLSKALQAAGSSLDDIVQARVYLTDLEQDFAEMNRIWVERFPKDMSPPARTTIGVAKLPMGACIEMDCIAELSAGSS
ncbi:YjgF-like protein [Flagelloscypha sp. PMI_526]|nr:YjgF-like protein [Flagelloscypha sp. PMI_526]